MNEEELKSFNIQIKDGKWYMGTLEHKAYEFLPETHLIVEGVKGERYAIERSIFEETYKINEPYETLENEWFALNQRGMHYSDGDEKIENFIKEEIEKNGLKSLDCLFQDGAILEVGINGLQWQHLITIALAILQKFNKNFPCRENAITITKLEEALMWQEKRTKDRKKEMLKVNRKINPSSNSSQSFQP